MLRSSLHLALVAALSTAGLSLPSPVHAAGPAVDADVLYEEGRKDFGAGFYKSAIEKDPGLGADPDEVKPVLVKIDAELARLEPEEAPVGPVEEPTVVPEPVDPGKKMRLAGLGLMGGGGAVLVVGGILGGVFAAKGGRLSADLDDLYGQQTMMNCPASQADESPSCAALRNEVAATRDDGVKANKLAVVSFGVVGGLGALLLIGGIVSYSLGKKRSAAWKSEAETARLRVSPTFGGLLITGRF